MRWISGCTFCLNPSSSGRHHLLALVGGHAHGLLAEHMLARRQQTQHRLDVAGVGRRDIDRIHVGIGDQGLVGAMRHREAMGFGELARPFLRAAGHGLFHAALGLVQSLRERLGDAAGADDSPT
jgi:hypothetical protein